MNLDSIRRAVRAKGLTPATVVPETSAGRAEEACTLNREQRER